MKSVKCLLPQVTELVFLPTCQFPPSESLSQLHQREASAGTPGSACSHVRSEPPCCRPGRASLTDAAAPRLALAPYSMPCLLCLVQTRRLAGTLSALRSGALFRAPLGDQQAGVCWGGDCSSFSLPTDRVPGPLGMNHPRVLALRLFVSCWSSSSPCCVAVKAPCTC